MTADLHDVVIVGGGPAGLSAALVLGRARKRTLLLDAGPSRGAAAHAVHGLLGHDGVSPAELRARGRRDLAPYPSVVVRDERAVSLDRDPSIHGGAGVRVGLESGASIRARRVLLAVGFVDVLPAIPGLRERWGRDVFSCPYCHGWELRDRVWGVLALERNAARTVLPSATWASELVLFAHGRDDLPEESLRPLRAKGVRIEPARVSSLVAEDDTLVALELEGGARVPCGALLVHPPRRMPDLVLFAGLALGERGSLRIDAHGETSMRGVHAAGDVAGARAHAVVAAADGAQAAMSLVDLLTMEDVDASAR